MHCLLCHEKIPRLRAWAGKSEFCCDEHAELYKKQTLERLMVDDSTDKKPAAGLPLAAQNAPAQSEASTVDPVLLGASESGNTKPARPELQDADELWKLAEKTGGKLKQRRKATKADSEVVTDQSADDALEALRALAAEAASSKAAELQPDASDELADLEASSKNRPQLEALPLDLAVAAEDAVEDAPELQLEALQEDAPALDVPEPPELEASSWEAAELERSDDEPPELELDALSADEAAPQAAVESIEPPELTADFYEEEDALTDPPEPVFEQPLAAASESPEESLAVADPPEPASLETPAETAASRRPAVASKPKVQPKLRAASGLRPLQPTAILPEGGYPLKPWTDALAQAGPDRTGLLGSLRQAELRKSSLNGATEAVFDPIEFKPCVRVAKVPVSLAQAKALEPVEPERKALGPSDAMVWPAPLYAVLGAAQMEFLTPSSGVDGGLLSLKQPSLTEEFLGKVTLQSQIFEPNGAVVLSPQERVGSADLNSGQAYMSGPNHEADGGERANVADLF